MGEVARQIGDAYGKGTFKRFIAVMDSCYSGQNVDGQKSIFLAGPSDQSTLNAKRGQQILENAISTMAGGIKTKSKGTLPFEQGLIVGASKRTQTSDDLGSSMGGAFTYSWRRALGQGLKGQSKTVGEILEESKNLTLKATGGSQTPVWRAMPESVLQESIIGLSPQIPLSKDIFAALGSAPDGSYLFASVPSTALASTVELCKGEKLTCMTKSSDISTRMTSAQNMNVAGRNIFRSDGAMRLHSGDVLTIVLRRQDGTIIEARSIRFNNR